jgi:hypothetical protein
MQPQYQSTICFREHTRKTGLDTWERKLIQIRIFSEVSLEAVRLAYSSDANSLTRTQVRERFYETCRQNLNSESGNES